MINKFKGLTGNQLKILAAITMTIDHIGLQLFPHITILRIIGRLSFPIFAYMIAEGCLYTKNKRRYLGTMLIFAFILQLVYFFVMHSLFQCILVTFSLSILLIYAYDNAVKKDTDKDFGILLLAFIFVLFTTKVMPVILSGTNYFVDYGFWGVMIPFFVYLGKTKEQKLLYFSAGLILLSASIGIIQWFSLAAIPLLALYNGKRGQARMKNFFYIYYPAHLAIIYVINYLIRSYL